MAYTVEMVQSKLLLIARPVECKPIIYTSIKIHVYSRQYSIDTIVYIDNNSPKWVGFSTNNNIGLHLIFTTENIYNITS